MGASRGMDPAPTDISTGTQNSINEMSHEISFESSESSPRTSNPANQNQKSQDMSGAAQSSIEDQRSDLQKQIPLDSDDPDQDIQKSKPLPGADDDVPDITNRFGYLCGRSQFCFRVNNPQDDCIGLRECCFLSLLTSDIVGLVSGSIWSYASVGHICTVVNCSPTLAAVGVTGSVLVYSCVGGTAYGCSLCMGYKDFSQSYRRGQLCLPEDICSNTSRGFNKGLKSQENCFDDCFKSCWTPCWAPCCGDVTKPTPKEL